MKRISILYRLLLLIFSALFLLSAYMVYSISAQARREQQAFDELEEIVRPSVQPLPDTEQPEKPPETSEVSSAYAALKEKNPDFFGWISIEGTKLDYPVMHTPEDGEYYLRRDFEGSHSQSGVPFLAADCYEGCGNYLIYGHHMKNGTMFKDIVKYKDQQYFDEHQDIILYTPDREIHLKALAAVVANPDAIRRKIDFQSWEEFTSYIEEMTQDARAFATVPKGTAIRRLYSFVTCSYEFQNARTILYAYEEN